MKKQREAIAVLAGTPVDTSIGVELLQQKGYVAVGYPIAQTLAEQNHLQNTNTTELFHRVLKAIASAKVQGIKRGIIFCNSLASALELKYLKMESDVELLTVMDVYKQLSLRLAEGEGTIGIVAFNANGAAGVERFLCPYLPQKSFVSVGWYPLVDGIEQRRDPHELLQEVGINEVVRGFVCQGVQNVVLGCTHFGNLQKPLEQQNPQLRFWSLDQIFVDLLALSPIS